MRQLLPNLLIRDQGVGGSNPLSPTNIFSRLQTSSKTIWFWPRGPSPQGRVDTAFLTKPECKAVYKNFLGAAEEGVLAGAEERSRFAMSMQADRLGLHWGLSETALRT